MKNLVILGAGTAGTMAAAHLAGPLAKREWKITIIDRDDEHHYQPGYLFVPFGTYTRKQVVKSRHSFIPEGVELVLTDIDRVNAEAHQVVLADGRTLDYDYLIIATGTQPHPEQVPGMAEAMAGDDARVHQFYTLPGAEKLHQALANFHGGRLLVHVCEMPIKCPVAPLEFALLADDYFTKKGMRERCEIIYVTPLDGAFTKPVAKRELGHTLQSRGIRVEPDFMVEQVRGDEGVLTSYDGRELPYDLLVTVPVNMGADYIARSGLGDDLNYVPVDKHTLRSHKYPEIFVLGDGSTIPTSKAGAVAHFAIETFVPNFLALIDGKPMKEQFDGHANCFVESGRGQGMLLDFNYNTEPLTGTFPLPKIGPMTLLKESRLNHLGKLAFRHLYWHFLMKARPLPIPAKMTMVGKRREQPEQSADPVEATLKVEPRSDQSPKTPTTDSPGVASFGDEPIVPNFDDDPVPPTSTDNPIIPSF